MPERPPRLDRAEDGMGIWLVGPEAQGDFAASAYDRIINGELRGRPVEVDGDTARHVVGAAATLAFTTPVLHDISNGGLAVALAEIAMASDVGFTIEDIPGPELFDETPLRFVAVTHGDRLDTDEPCRRIGTMGGELLDFGESGSVGLADARDIWSNALPRRMS
jgi:phosphoribosylformylglycinamidine synthase